MIKAKNLTKRFGSQVAVDHLDFEIPSSQVVGFLGPNGAGKTTTMRLLTAYLPPDEGTAELLGMNVSDNTLAVRKRLGYLPENNPLYGDFEVTDSLHFVGLVRGLKDQKQRVARIRSVLKTCGLEGVVGKKVFELSKGYRQRLGLAQAIIHDPDVLILDEPTSGLDPNQVSEVRDLIRELKKEKTLLLSTHILSEVTATCDRVIIINKGRIVADGSPEELSGNLQNKNRLFVELKGDPAAVKAELEKMSGLSSIRLQAEGAASGFILESESSVDLRESVFEVATDKRWPILSLRQEKLSLEEVFRTLTRGEEDRSAPPKEKT